MYQIRAMSMIARQRLELYTSMSNKNVFSFNYNPVSILSGLTELQDYEII
jgi:hypothetical protein